MPALNDHPIFIDAIADLVYNHLKDGPKVTGQLLSRFRAECFYFYIALYTFFVEMSFKVSLVRQ